MASVLLVINKALTTPSSGHIVLSPGCDTCDFGSKYEVEIVVEDFKINLEDDINENQRINY